MTGVIDGERRYHHGDLRSALTLAAVAQVDEVGLDHLSLRAAASTVGVSPSAAYHHFADKDALLAAVSLAANASLDAAMQRAVAAVRGSGPGAARSRVRASMRAYLQFAIDHPRLFRAAFSGHASVLPAEAGQPGVAADAAYGRASALLDQLVETGAVPDSFRKGAEEIIWATIHGLATLILEGFLDVRRLDEYLADMERLLMSPAASSSTSSSTSPVGKDTS